MRTGVHQLPLAFKLNWHLYKQIYLDAYVWTDRQDSLKEIKLF